MANEHSRAVCKCSICIDNAKMLKARLFSVRLTHVSTFHYGQQASTLQPAIRGRSSYLGFTFRELSCFTCPEQLEDRLFRRAHCDYEVNLKK